MSQLNVSKYTKVPQFGVRGGVALGSALGAALPEAAPDTVKAAAEKIASKVAALQEGWAARDEATPTDARAVDARVDTAWRATHDALKGLSALQATPRGQTARRFFELLFADGLSFVKLPYREQWAECEKRLLKLRDTAVTTEFNDLLGGPEHLDELVSAHEAYGRALDITNAAEAPPDPDVASAIRELRDAISSYTVHVLSWSLTSPENEQLAKRALLPIDAWRAVRARSKSETPQPPEAGVVEAAPAAGSAVASAAPAAPVTPTT